MAAVILGWNPESWNWDGAYPHAVTETVEAGRHLRRWPIGPVMNLSVGTEVWLLVEGGRPNQRGLIGHGIIVSEPFAAETGGTGHSRYVQVEFDRLLPSGDQLRTDELETRVPDVGWQSVGAAGAFIPPHSLGRLRAAWVGHLLDGAGDSRSLEPVPGAFPEDALSRMAVNRYERDADAGKIAIAHHGAGCAACGFDFEQTYGVLGAGVVSLHHTVPVSQLGPGYQLDPTADLVPLCPNCHHMAHRRKPEPYTVAELKAMIPTGGHLRGTVMTDEQIAAEEAAQRLMQNQEPL